MNAIAQPPAQSSRFARRLYTLGHRLGLVRPLLWGATRAVASDGHMRRSVAGWTPAASDVVVATFMKSGTNWMMQVALQTAHRGAAEFDHIHDLVPWPDAPGPGAVPLADPRPKAEAPTGLRIIKTHGAATLFPYNKAAKYIVVLRDPKEVLVSAYHFILPLLGLADRVDPALWLTLYRMKGLQAWVDHSASWWALRDEPNVEVLRFAQMKADLPGTVDRISAFMGVDLDAAARAAVIERGGFAWMKAHNSQFRPIKLPFFDPDTVPDMVRRGASGGADELYSPAQLAALDRRVLKLIARRGVDLPYRDLFNCAD